MTLSQKMALTLHSLHRQLLDTLVTEKNLTVLTECLDTLSKLVENCTYTKLSVNYRLEVYRTLVRHTKSVDPQVSRAALHGLCVLLDSGYESAHALKDLLSETLDSIQKCVSQQNKEWTTAWLSLLSAVIRSNFGLSRDIWPKIQNTLLPLLSQSSSQKSSLPNEVREAVTQCVLDYATSLSSEGRLETAQLDSTQWWPPILPLLYSLLSDPHGSVRALTLDTLSRIRSSAFTSLSARDRLSLLTVSLGMLHDTNPMVRSASCGVLGELVTFDTMKQDHLFMVDVATQIPPLVKEEESLMVRMRASWALANLCQSLAQEKPPCQIDFPGPILQTLVDASLFAGKDKDRVCFLPLISFD